jgi:hypothetical protein
MTRSELEGKIKKMETGLNNPNIQGDAKQALEDALSKAKAQLAEMEKPEPESKKPAPKPIPQRRSRVKNPAPSRAVTYSWKKKADLTKLQPIVNHCQHYALIVDQEMQVGIKGKGSGTRKVDVLAGEALIFDDKGYLVYVMDEGSFKAKCIYKTTIEKHESDLHKKEEFEELQKEVSQLRQENKKLKSESSPKPAAKKEMTKPKRPAKKTTPKRKKQETNPKPKAPAKITAPKSSAKTSLEVLEKEIDDVRKASKLPPNKEEFKKEYKELASKMDQKSFAQYVKARLKDGEDLTESQVIKLAIALRPLYQKLPGAIRDIVNENKKVLKPNYTNLLRWIENPGRYDLQGVDIPITVPATVQAKAPKNSSVFALFGID